MQGAALVEHFILGHEDQVDEAWATLGRVLPRLHLVGDGGDFHVRADGADDLEAVIRDLAALGWNFPFVDDWERGPTR